MNLFETVSVSQFVTFYHRRAIKVPKTVFPRRGRAECSGTKGETQMSRAIYPGSFDPVTLGHLDIIERAARVLDELIIGVLVNNAKTPLFTIEERVEMLRECTKQYPNVSVATFDGMTVDFARSVGATVMIRGLRAVTDFEVEMQIAQTNHIVEPAIDTMFFTTSLQYAYLSSTIVKEVAYYGSDVSKFVTPNVAARLREKYAEGRHTCPKLGGQAR